MVKSKMSLTYKFLTAINSYFVVTHAGFKNLVLSCRLKSASDVSHKLVGQTASVTDTLLHLHKLTASSEFHRSQFTVLFLEDEAF